MEAMNTFSSGQQSSMLYECPLCSTFCCVRANFFVDHQSHTFWELIFLVQDTLVGELNVGLGPLSSWREALHFLLFSCLWVAQKGVWVLTVLCLYSSYPFHCSSLFIFSVVENLSASLEVPVDSFSVILTLVYPWGEVHSGSSYSSILATFLPKIGFLHAYAMQPCVSTV